VRGHHAVQGGTTWGEPFLLGLIATQNQAHEFAHAVSWISNHIKIKKNEMWFAFQSSFLITESETKIMHSIQKHNLIVVI
jgi:hypothetical protein